MEFYKRHIGQRKAAPDCCPMCGGKPFKAFSGNSILDCLTEFYNSPAHIYSEEIPGWTGYKTWFFECKHSSPMEQAVYHSNPFLAFISKTEFSGKPYLLPLGIS